MDRYTPRKLRPWALTAMALRGIIRLLEFWPLVLIVALYVSPLQPHLLTTYRYIESGNTRIMTDCDYLGPRGFVKYQIGTRCPVIVVLDTRNYTDAVSVP